MTFDKNQHFCGVSQHCAYITHLLVLLMII